MQWEVRGLDTASVFTSGSNHTLRSDLYKGKQKKEKKIKTQPGEIIMLLF